MTLWYASSQTSASTHSDDFHKADLFFIKEAGPLGMCHGLKGDNIEECDCIDSDCKEVMSHGLLDDSI